MVRRKERRLAADSRYGSVQSAVTCPLCGGGNVSARSVAEEVVGMNAAQYYWFCYECKNPFHPADRILTQVMLGQPVRRLGFWTWKAVNILVWGVLFMIISPVALLDILTVWLPFQWATVISVTYFVVGSITGLVLWYQWARTAQRGE